MTDPLFNRDALQVKPLAERRHDLDLDVMMPLEPVPENDIPPAIKTVAGKLREARQNQRGLILMMGAHVIRSGVQRYLIDLMRRGYIGCLAMNGSGIIHDYEFALIGATTESVARYIKTGEFGLWQETGVLNDFIREGWEQNKQQGLGEVIGRKIADGQLPHREFSLLAEAWQLGIPATIHVGIGYDIIHEHPNCDGAATGGLSYNDFLKYARMVQDLEGGVIMNFGSSIMAPEVFLKALSMARNVAAQQQKEIRRFTTLVCDLHDLPDDFRTEPGKDSAAYYFRPWKTMLVRTVADGGESFYVKGRHAQTLPALWTALNKLETGSNPKN